MTVHEAESRGTVLATIALVNGGIVAVTAVWVRGVAIRLNPAVVAAALLSNRSSVELNPYTLASTVVVETNNLRLGPCKFQR